MKLKPSRQICRLVTTLVCAVMPVFTCNNLYAQEYLFAVNEGVTYQDGSVMSERLKPFIEMIEKELKHPVKLLNISSYADFERDLKDERYDLVFIHPAHIGLKAVKTGNYFGVATAKDFTQYRARVMVAKESKAQSLSDLKNQKIGVPALESITTVMFSASLRELGMDTTVKQFLATRYQDAVPFMVENGFVAAGVTGSAAVAKKWTDKGGRVIAETPSVPIKHFLVSKRLSQGQREKMKNLLLNLSTAAQAKSALSGLNLTGFVPWEEQVMKDATIRLGL